VRATVSEIRVWSWDGTTLDERCLGPGDHVIVNRGVDPADHPYSGGLPAGADWVALLATDPVLIDGTVAGKRYGSTSTSLVRLSAGRREAQQLRAAEVCGAGRTGDGQLLVPARVRGEGGVHRHQPASAVVQDSGDRVLRLHRLGGPAALRTYPHRGAEYPQQQI